MEIDIPEREGLETLDRLSGCSRTARSVTLPFSVNINGLLTFDVERKLGRSGHRALNQPPRSAP
jgi:hypothetical protein